MTKNFRGGEITAFFGGGEIDLSRGELEGVATIDLTITMGGVKLLIPRTWQVLNEVGVIFGGIDDRRVEAEPNTNKVLILTGTCLFGGLEIASC